MTPTQTAASTLSVATLAPVLGWALGGFHGDPPTLQLAGLAIPVIHLGWTWLQAKIAASIPPSHL